MEKIQNPGARCQRSNGGVDLMDRLPEGMFTNILGRLDLESLCSVAPVSRTLNTLVSQSLSCITTLDLSGFPPDVSILDKILKNNKVLQCLTLDCLRLDDSAIKIFAKEHLHKLVLMKCSHLSTRLFQEIGEYCPNLRVFMFEIISDVGDCDNKTITKTSVRELGSHLEILWIRFLHFQVDEFLCIESFPATLEVLLLQSITEQQAMQSIAAATSTYPINLRNLGTSLQKLSLILDIITDELLGVIVLGLPILSELYLQDLPLTEPLIHHDMSDDGFRMLGSLTNLTRLSLVRKREGFSHPKFFTRVTDMGMFLFGEECNTLESITFSGFAKVTDAGFTSIINSSKKLKRIEIINAKLLSDSTFSNLAGGALWSLLVHLKLISCKHLTSETVMAMVPACKNLEVLNLSGCVNIGDESMASISKLGKLTKLDLCGTNITDKGLSTVGNTKSPIMSLSIRSCIRVSSLLVHKGTLMSRTLTSLDLSSIPGITDNSIFTIAEVCTEMRDLCLRCCFSITDASIEALGWLGRYDAGRQSCLQRLDLFRCNRLTSTSYLILTGVVLRKLRWVGIGSTSFEYCQVDVKKPCVVFCRYGCEMGCLDGCHLNI